MCVYVCVCVSLLAGVRPTLIGPVCVTAGCYLIDSGPCQCSSSHHLLQIEIRKRKYQHRPSDTTQDTHTRVHTGPPAARQNDPSAPGMDTDDGIAVDIR